MGQLYAIKIWHDNSGKRGMASWYLKHLIVHDLQTREKFYFICERWMAVEKDDGRCDRLLTLSEDEQKLEEDYLTSRHTRNSLNDQHLWLSVFNRPPQSSFTRLERLLVIAFIFYASMLINALIYDRMEIENKNDEKINAFWFSSEQVSNEIEF